MIEDNKENRFGKLFKAIFDAFSYDRLEVSPDIVRYLIDNELIGALNVLKIYDEDGSKIKRFALDLKKDNSKNKH